MESLAKILEFIGKYAWAVFLTVAFVLFTPADWAKEIGIMELRTTAKISLWITLVFTAVLVLSAAFQYFWRCIKSWFNQRKDSRAQELALEKEVNQKHEEAERQREHEAAAEKQALEVIKLRLQSLYQYECMWIKYCLFTTFKHYQRCKAIESPSLFFIKNS